MPERRFADLHTHSTASDGTLSPAEVIARAAEANLAAVALTDHDTTAGLARARDAAAGCEGLTFVPGVEVSARYPGGTMHILGLGIDEDAPAVRNLLASFIEARRERNPKIIAKLQGLGLAVDMDDVLAAAGTRKTDKPRVLGRLHIAEALRVKGYADSIPDAFARYLRDDGPAFVDKERIEPREVIEALDGSAAVAVLAHPGQLGLGDGAELERYVRTLAGWGLGGIEVYHSDHTDQSTRRYLEIARGLHLTASGGSDFHGRAKPNVQIGRPRVPLAAITGRLAELVDPDRNRGVRRNDT